MENKKILVVDDDPSIRDLMFQYFQIEGYSVFCASDGESAMEVVTSERPALIFLDLFLPKSPGIEVLKQIKQICPESFVVMLSGAHDELIAKKAIECGAYDYVTKPISLKQLNQEFVQRIFG